ncbi:MAG: hypothetical protein ACW99A_02670 [Candidatus Kariarchaeaceae archaeon]|jgi:heptaprenylglyceryl phosphate synthase
MYLGVLGDPAKLHKYSEEFYEILKSEFSNNVFHLLGASEYDVTNKDYQSMYGNLHNVLNNYSFPKFDLFGSTDNNTKFNSRVGLFPSHRNQLIPGPNFVFAPFPSISSSLYLKLQARITITLFHKFSKYNIIKIGYFPFGGKAAERTKSYDNNNTTEIQKQFSKTLGNKWFNWVYLEAGSGETHMDPAMIQSIISDRYTSKFHSFLGKRDDDVRRHIIPKTIYGGGINSPTILRKLLEPGSESIYVPECVIIGNISEKNISVTYDIIETFNELNSIPTKRI